MSMLQRSTKPGFALATILILLGVCLFTAAAVITVSVLESKISVSQRLGEQAYYVGEAGVQDGMWRLKTDSTLRAALLAGTLNTTYTANNVPQTGSSFTVKMTQVSGQPNGTGSIDVTGQVASGGVTAKRRVVATVFLGPNTPPSGKNAVLTGGSATFSNGAAVISVQNGDLYSDSTLGLANPKINMNGNNFISVGNFTENPSPSKGVTNVGSVQAPNRGSSPSPVSVPSFDFAAAKTAAKGSNTYYTPAQFTSLIPNGNGNKTLTLPGPVTYIDGALAMDNNYKRLTINVSGELVINGNLTVPASTTGVGINISSAGQPSGTPSGIFVSGALSIQAGTWDTSGVFYSAGSMTFSNSSTFTLNGALLAGGALSVNNGQTMNLNFVASAVSNVFGGTPSPVLVNHWEEEY